MFVMVVLIIINIFLIEIIGTGVLKIKILNAVKKYHLKWLKIKLIYALVI
jgi:hypothetical protein